MSESTGGVAPRTIWEYCLSAADELTLGQGPGVAGQQALVVVVLAAVIAGCADADGLEGARVGEVPLDGEGGVLGLLRCGARPTVRSCPATPGLGAEQRQELLAIGREEFAVVRDLAEAVLAAHLAGTVGGPTPTVRQAAAAAVRARTLRTAGRVLGVDEED